MRVAHQPAAHPFVDAVTMDRRPRMPISTVWDVGRLVAADVELVHVHFGFEHLDEAAVRRWADDLDAAGIALVHTAHDLDNPHLEDQRVFHRTVGVLIDAAGALTTLTAVAARSIEARYGASATVVPHTHVVPLDDAVRTRRTSHRHGIYVHVATGRPNVCLGTIERLVARSDRRPVRVHVRPEAPTAVHERLTRLAARGRIHLDVRGRLTDAELWERLAGAELLVLPYRWGTHSGLLEAAHDLGTPVLAPTFGGYGDQGAITFDDDPAPFVAAAISHRPPVTVASRQRQQRHAMDAYAHAYRSASTRIPA